MGWEERAEEAGGAVKLFLDDVREPPPGFELARTVSEFIDKIQSNEYEVISLDHDIEDGLDGYIAANQVIMERDEGKLKELKLVIIHSANKDGRENMYDQLVKHLKGVAVEVRPMEQAGGYKSKTLWGEVQEFLSRSRCEGC